MICPFLFPGISVDLDRLEVLNDNERAILEAQGSRAHQNMLRALETSEAFEGMLSAHGLSYPHCKMRYTPLFRPKTHSLLLNFAQEIVQAE